MTLEDNNNNIPKLGKNKNLRTNNKSPILTSNRLKKIS